MSVETPPPSLPVPVAATTAFKRSFLLNPWFWATALLAVLFVWLFLETRVTLTNTRQDMARNLARHDVYWQEARAHSKKTTQELSELRQQYATLEGRVAEFQGQAEALHDLYQETTANRNETLLAEVEQNLRFAAQQLQLAGNIEAALLALETADQRLERQDARFLTLRRALAGDLEKLRAAPFVDVAGISLRLEQILSGVDRLPFTLDALSDPDLRKHRISAADEKAQQSERADESNDAGQGWTAYLGAITQKAWEEIKSLVRIERLDQPEPLLLSHERRLALRENLKLRLLNARLALFMRDAWTFKQEITGARALLQQYFSMESGSVRAADQSLRQLADIEVAATAPSVQESLSALQKTRADIGVR
ncbi:MAG: uroporphyrinogen-III C-methyltransferase [Zoogloeaceae bacterium]|jgi:uroporphyrin-3 C-methyltransferase|nr:uroporphyrinogen-III C-methyltransferase [Zoogloeaceae bacterium]